MLTIELNAIEYLDVIKKIFRDNKFKFLLLGVVRYGDSQRYFQELEQFWQSINNVTSKKIIFLNFSDNKNKDEKTFINIGCGEKIITRGIQMPNQFSINSYIEENGKVGHYKKLAEEFNSNYFLNIYYHELNGMKLKYVPKIKKKINKVIDESASEILHKLNRREADVPFIYLYDLETNDEYYFCLNAIYKKYNSIYEFIREVIMKIDIEVKSISDLKAVKQEIETLGDNLKKRKSHLIRKKRQLNSISRDLNWIRNLLNNKEYEFNDEQSYYLNSILNCQDYYLKYPLKDLFPKINFGKENINNVIHRYSNRNLKTYEIDLKKWIELEEVEIKKVEQDFEKRNKEYENKNKEITIELKKMYEDILTEKKNESYREIDSFKVALTFAGENRAFVEKIAVSLEEKLGKGKVFYDNFFQGVLARTDLDLFLQDIYQNKSDFIVVFLSKDYESKEWCGLELRAIRDLIKKKESQKIIPVKLEECKNNGFFSIDGYLDGLNNTPNEISKLIYQRICSS